ncbi:MAG: hypothetical protein HRK26_00630 [Rickettsiaceae bacterium H1]|nr:hypothetical protein [Rickettsiaceae bacterium H1]
MPSGILDLHKKAYDKFGSASYLLVPAMNIAFVTGVLALARMLIKLNSHAYMNPYLLRFASLETLGLIILSTISVLSLCVIGFAVNNFIANKNREKVVQELMKLEVKDEREEVIKEIVGNITNEHVDEIYEKLKSDNKENIQQNIENILIKNSSALENGKKLLALDPIMWLPQGIVEGVKVSCSSKGNGK